MENNPAIQLLEGRQVRVTWNAEQEKYYFSVTDIVQVLTDSADAKQYFKRMRSRDPELNVSRGTICTPTEMRAADGKVYKTQAADSEGIPYHTVHPLEGGSVAKEARETMEKRLGRSVVSPERASDYITPIETAEAQELPFDSVADGEQGD